MPGRKYNSAAYRYGFNGKEKDQEGEFGSITNYDYGFRIYNPAIGRFLSVDPLSREFPFYTPYQFAGNKPIVALDLDGLEDITLHSAFWADKFWNMPLNLMSNDQIINAAKGLNKNNGGVHGGFINKESQKWAMLHYGSPGVITTIKDAQKGELIIRGFTNATSGDVIEYTIFQSLVGFEFIEIKIPDIPKGLKNEFSGVEGVAGRFVLNFTFYGKFTRALFNYMEGVDPYTGEDTGTKRLLIDGALDLATIGFGGPGSAGTNIGLNLIQDAIENTPPEELAKLGIEESDIGIFREAVDLGIANMEGNKIIKVIELTANLIQAGLLVNDDKKARVEKSNSQNVNESENQSN